MKIVLHTLNLSDFQKAYFKLRYEHLHWNIVYVCNDHDPSSLILMSHFGTKLLDNLFKFIIVIIYYYLIYLKLLI